VLMAVSILGLEQVLFPAPGLLRFVALAVLVGAGMAVYFAAAHLLGAVDLREVRGLLRRRRKQPAAAPSA
jgi:putative peptidoglycan lipid II flippase